LKHGDKSNTDVTIASTVITRECRSEITRIPATSGGPQKVCKASSLSFIVCLVKSSTDFFP
jgi:hypothetical protein